MEKFKKLSTEAAYLTEQLERKKRECIKEKLRYLSQNKDDKNAHLTEEEWKILKDFLLKHKDCTSVIMEESYSYCPDGPDDKRYDTIVRIGDKYVTAHECEPMFQPYVGEEPYEFKVCDKLNIEQGVNGITINGISFVERHEYSFSKTKKIGGKDELTKPLDIEGLFEDERRQVFEKALVRDDVVDYFLLKSKDELEEQFGPEVARMVDFEQKNSHHCYDLWEHTLRTVEGVTRDKLNNPNFFKKNQEFTKLRVAAFFHDIGKPDVASINPRTGQQVFYDHAHHSVDVAKPILEKLGYSEEEIAQLSFYIGHHDDFISYRTEVPPYMQNHEFVREINSDTIAEKIIENKYDFAAMGYNKDQIRAIVYTLAHGKSPDFRTKDGPISIPIDMDEVKAKMISGEYEPEYEPTKNDYHLLLQLCMADAGAQSEVAKRTLPNGEEVIDGTKAGKLENMNNIEALCDEAYDKAEDITKSIPESTKKSIEENTGYSFEEFIAQTKDEFQRPRVVMGDGVSMSVQASAFHYCEPRRSGLDTYKSYEVGYPSKVIEQLREYAERPAQNDEELLDFIYPFVPAEVLSQIVMEHGGINKEATLNPERKLDGYKDEKAEMQEKNAEIEKFINQLMQQLGNDLEDHSHDDE